MHEVNKESQETAIVNLHMLMQYATGETKPKKTDDPTVRYQKVLAFIMTGSCVVDDNLKPTIEAIQQAFKIGL